MEDQKKLGKELFSQGFNCAQSVIAPFASTYGEKIDNLLRISASFGGGLARQGKTCGAVSGALMAIGLKYGQDTKSNADAKDLCYQKSSEFVKEFEQMHGSSQCNDLVGIDITDPVQATEARETGKFKKLCPNFVETSITLLEKYL
jgi:C_GCAxxG_C_C family probable redox protein